jgi:AraC-like DNA-binding protein
MHVMVVRFRAKSAAEQRAEARLGRPIEGLIRDGIEAGKTIDAIASEVEVSPRTVARWMKRMGLRVRKVLEVA